MALKEAGAADMESVLKRGKPLDSFTEGDGAGNRMSSGKQPLNEKNSELDGRWVAAVIRRKLKQTVPPSSFALTNPHFPLLGGLLSLECSAPL